MSMNINTLIDWAIETASEKPLFGLDSLNAALHRGIRIKSVLIDAKEHIVKLEKENKMLLECVEFTSNQVYPYSIHEHIDDLERRFGECIDKSKETLKQLKESK